MGVSRALPVSSGGGGRMCRRHEEPLLSSPQCHHGPAVKVCVNVMCAVNVHTEELRRNKSEMDITL